MQTWVEKVPLHVGGVEVERACGVNDHLERRLGYDCLIKSIRLGDVFDNGKIEFVFGYIRVGSFDSLRLLSRSHCSHHRVALLQ